MSTQVDRLLTLGVKDDLRGLVVVVLDHELVTREKIAGLLAARGASVATSGSASDALARVQALKPAVVFVSVQPGDTDGVDFIRRLRQLADSTAEMPVISMSRSRSESQQHRVRTAGFNAGVVVPASAEELAIAVRRALAPAEGVVRRGSRPRMMTPRPLKKPLATGSLTFHRSTNGPVRVESGGRVVATFDCFPLFGKSEWHIAGAHGGLSPEEARDVFRLWTLNGRLCVDDAST